jgi:hypothetical protein
MLTLRCTERLLKKRLGPLGQGDDDLKPTLGHWHANLLRLGRTPVVLTVNDTSRLALLLPGRDFPNLLIGFRARFVQQLRRLGVPEDRIACEAAAMKSIRLDRTASRSVLGTMNDFAFQLRWRFNEGRTLQDADYLEDDLAETPISTLEYACPKEAARAAFGLPESPKPGARYMPKASKQKYPLGTVCYYGPNDRTVMKVVLAIIPREDAEPSFLKRWVGSGVSRDIKVVEELKRLLSQHQVKSVVATDGVIGCVHEEGLDFPLGQDCPFCPFWRGKQGSAKRTE